MPISFYSFCKANLMWKLANNMFQDVLCFPFISSKTLWASFHGCTINWVTKSFAICDTQNDTLPLWLCKSLIKDLNNFSFYILASKPYICKYIKENHLDPENPSIRFFILLQWIVKEEMENKR